MKKIIHRIASVLIKQTPVRTSLYSITLSVAVLQAGAVNPPPDVGYPNRNTAEGTDALLNLNIDQGKDNTAIGFDALFSDTSGYGNTAVGSDALYNNNSINNTGVGWDSLYSNTTGS